MHFMAAERLQRLRDHLSHAHAFASSTPASGGGQMAPRDDWDNSFAPPPVRQVSARCRTGVSRKDITPPAGIYNRNWGAAQRDTSTGNHGTLRVSAIAFAPLADDNGDAPPLVLVTVDLGWLLAAETAELCSAIGKGCGIDPSR